MCDTGIAWKSPFNINYNNDTTSLTGILRTLTKKFHDITSLFCLTFFNKWLSQEDKLTHSDQLLRLLFSSNTKHTSLKRHPPFFRKKTLFFSKSPFVAEDSRGLAFDANWCLCLSFMWCWKLKLKRSILFSLFFSSSLLFLSSIFIFRKREKSWNVKITRKMHSDPP